MRMRIPLKMRAKFLKTAPGFDWSRVVWGGPNDERTQHCSYCGEPFPDDDNFMPLILWKHEGSAAEFCEQCQRDWFGLQSSKDDETQSLL